jgi:hypothetical protein
VHLILGNRDLNKLRLATELSSAAIADPAVVADTSHPAWVPQEQRVPYESFLQALGGHQHNTLPNRCTPLASPASCHAHCPPPTLHRSQQRLYHQRASAGLRTTRHGDQLERCAPGVEALRLQGGRGGAG